MKHADYKNTLKGVSTLDIMKKHTKAILFLIILTAVSANIFGGHSTLDIVDPNFNPQIQTSSYGGKIVHQVEVQPDGKIIVFGFFSSFNRVPTGRVVRLNADGSLDQTFNTQTVTSSQDSGGRVKILIQPDGKIVLMAIGIVAAGQPPKTLIRLNSDGTLDTNFNYALNLPADITIDSFGRIFLVGFIQTPQGTRKIVRLNADGSLDTTFNFTDTSTSSVGRIAPQGNRLIAGGGNARIFRLNENGSEDASFPPIPTTGLSLSALIVQPDDKIIYQNDRLRRLNPNGDTDTSFQTSQTTGNLIQLAPDGKIVTASSSSDTIFRRFLSNGAVDTSFNQFRHQRFSYCFGIESDGSIVTGDQSNLNDSTADINNFIRLTPAGAPDPAFNPGGIGFQNILPGSIRAIDPQPDGKILLGGKFDLINNVSRIKLARLNGDSTVDASFQVNTSGTGNYFSVIRDIYQIRTQTDGKIVVSGFFNYVLNGETRQNLARLNSDGSIDTTFNLTYPIPDYSEIVGASRNRFSILSGNNLIVGNSKLNGFGLSGPVALTEGGARDTSFNPTINNQAYNMYVDDLAVQPDGKIIIVGSYSGSGAPFNSFIARLNADGTTDTAFTYTEEPGRLRSLTALLPNGKILVVKHSNGSLVGRIERLNADGTADSTFNSLSIPNGIINALLVLPGGKIFVGGKFTVSINGQTGRNLLQLGADGSLEPTVYNVNEEVLCLAADNQGRVLVGGGFTVIGSNGSGAARSYVARLTDSRTRFDFDGDGRADLGVFNNTSGDWNIFSSQTNQAVSANFGLSSDKTAPADYDGDGRSDIAVFRPSNGVWYLLKSRDGFSAIQWGLAEDKPVAADYDGDDLADIAVWRPSGSVWYIRQSSNGQVVTMQFGLPDDIPLTDADFDGDGKADIAVWRPTNGVFYWMASGAAAGSQFRAVQFGLPGDIPVVGDYNGDGKTDLVVFRPTEGNWYQYLTQPNGDYIYSIFNFGLNGDEPVAADYDGDGKTDFAVRRGNVWHINRTGQGYISTAFADAEHKAVASSLNR